MAKYRVYGEVIVSVYTDVEATSPEEAINFAYNECSSLTSFVGNGGTGRLVGVYDGPTRLELGDEIEYSQAEIVEYEDEDD